MGFFLTLWASEKTLSFNFLFYFSKFFTYIFNNFGVLSCNTKKREIGILFNDLWMPLNYVRKKEVPKLIYIT